MARRGRAPPGALPGAYRPGREDHRHARLREPPASRPFRAPQALLTSNPRASLIAPRSRGTVVRSFSRTEGVDQPLASGNSEPQAWPAGGHLPHDLVLLVRPAHKRRPESAICRYFSFPPRATSGPQVAALMSWTTTEVADWQGSFEAGATGLEP